MIRFILIFTSLSFLISCDNHKKITYKENLEQAIKQLPQEPIPYSTFTPATTNNSYPNGIDNSNFRYYQEKIDALHQRQLKSIERNADWDLKNDCRDSGGTWGGRSTGCY